MQGLAAAVIGAFAATANGRGGGPASLFSGLFAGTDQQEWPLGVQEDDAPRFAVEHAQALRPGADDVPADEGATDGPGQDVGDIIELFNRRLKPG